METWRSYATICRLCLQKDGFMLGIFNHIQGKDRSIYKKIIDCTALQITHGDGLPNVICHRCLYKIEFCLEFRQLCFMSDATLRQLAAANKENDGTNGNAQLPLYEQLASTGQDENVVMVIDPLTYDYESDYDSEKEQQSDVENGESNDLEPESRGVIMCKYCDYAFTDSAECLSHETAAHSSDTPYNCHSCAMGFADRVVYSAHLKSIHKNDKPYNCPQCDKTFARRSDLRKHTIVHTGVKPFTCAVCSKSFSRNTNLSKHMRLHSGTKPFVCPKCPRTFTSKADLAKHSVVHAGQKTFSCNYCHLNFRRRDKLQRHEKRHFPQENSEDKSQELQLMRETLSIYSHANGDQKTEEGDEKQENMVINLDPFSHNNFPTEATPRRGENSENEQPNDHDTSIEGEATEDLIKDAKIEPTTSKKSAESDTKPFKCSQCSKRFSKAENLLTHQATHSDKRPFGCYICSKSFIRKRELDRHIVTHSGMKPYKCPRCNKSFGRKDKMMRHMRIHDIKKSFNCTICESTFNRRDGLQHHMKTHAVKTDNEDDSVSAIMA